MDRDQIPATGGRSGLLPESRRPLWLLWSLVVAVAFVGSGCSALHPLQGHSADELPPHFSAPYRSLKDTIDLSLLRQNPPPEHLVDGGDILGIYVEGILGNRENEVPVFLPNQAHANPAIGYPIRVDMDGTVSLPSLDPIPVRGMTIPQVRQAIRTAYTVGPNALLQPGKDHIHVSLQKPRTHRVFVIREESGNAQGNRGPAMTVNFDIDKRGTGRVVELPAHRNDVLNALTETGGLPGLDAENVIYVIRGAACSPAIPPTPQQPAEPHPTWKVHPNPAPPTANHSVTTAPRQRIRQPIQRAAATQAQSSSSKPHSRRRPPQHGMFASYRSAAAPLQRVAPASHQEPFHLEAPQLPPPHEPPIPAAPVAAIPVEADPLPASAPACCRTGGHIIRIPLKVIPGEPLEFGPEDVVLYDGDIVFVENRVSEFFYTAGLLGGGQYVLPRDYDLGVMDAIAIAEAERERMLPTSSIGGASVLNQDVSVGASKVIVQRKLPEGHRIPIEIDLYDLMERPDQQIMIQPEDRIILRYTPAEAVAAFFERFFIEGAVIGIASSLTFGD